VTPDELPLSRASLDRSALLRSRPGVVAQALADPRTRVLLVSDGAVVTAEGDELLLLAPGPVLAMLPDGPDDDEVGTWLLLGQDGDGAVHLARRVPARRPAPRTGQPADVLVHRGPGPTGPDDLVASLPAGAVWTPLREVGADLSARDAGLATAAVALDAWHSRHPRCPRCGAATRVAQAGWSRLCTVDGSEHYPRTDPAVIMSVVDGADRILLGHAAHWPEGRWSTLAGFVESGESLEHAVRREVLEETGVQVGEVAYRGSQPWPFPASLMLGFRAEAISAEVVPDGVELTAARWYTRDELRAAVDCGQVVPPGRSSIARALIEEWFGGPLPVGPDPARRF